METANIQVLFFQQIKSLLPSHISLVDAVADLLELSNDSAYRRIRGEKPLGLEEMQRLAKHYKISVDQLFEQSANTGIYSGALVDPENFDLTQYLLKLVSNLQAIAAFKNKE